MGGCLQALFAMLARVIFLRSATTGPPITGGEIVGVVVGLIICMAILTPLPGAILFAIGFAIYRLSKQAKGAQAPAAAFPVVE